MYEIENVEQWKGQPVVDRDGEKVGKLDDVLIDLRSGEPTLASVKVGRLSRSTVLVPLAGATISRDHVRLIHAKDIVESAPAMAVDSIRREDELLLGRHYGVTVPEADGAEEGDRPLYLTSTAMAEKQRADAAALAKAEELEAEAHRKQGVVIEGQTEAAQAAERADAADEERRRLLAEADELRRSTR